MTRRTVDEQASEIAAQLLARIQAGEWTRRLPAHAELADDLGVSPRVVGLACRKLRDAGHLLVVAHKGTFVNGGRPTTDRWTGP